MWIYFIWVSHGLPIFRQTFRKPIFGHVYSNLQKTEHLDTGKIWDKYIQT